ncbi:MAG TPA: DUF2610 domain-containing protein [Beijerinckiaceae bacterium]|jgi:hypothetical protein
MKTTFGLLLAWLMAAAALIWCDPAAAARRAFLVGIERYADPNIQRLTRSVRDAQDLAKDLQLLGFDKKNVTVVTDPRAKSDFENKFAAFVKTIEEDDEVVFFFSGHGLGVDIQSTNYLLFGELKSLFTYTRGKVSDAERKNANIVNLRMPSFVDQYETEEVVRNGISVTEIQNRIAARKPRVAFLILDACRSLAAPDDTKRAKRGAESGSRLVRYGDVPTGFMVLFSASFGEQAVESFGDDDSNNKRGNSLFTEMLRSELWRPGQTLPALAERVRLVVRAAANKGGQQQEPEFAANLSGAAEDFTFIDGIGAERFATRDDTCNGSEDDLAQILRLPKREELERHVRRFKGCKTAEKARWRLANLSDTTEEAAVAAPAAPGRTIDDCDRLAASSQDSARPPEVPGVRLEQIDADEARKACRLSISRNPRVTRFLFNLGRAEQAATERMRADDPERQEAFVRARLAFDDAAKRGYVAALNNLAILHDNGYGVTQNREEANRLLKQAAQQGFPLGMYNLGLRYESGEMGIQRDLVQAYEWFARAAESGFEPAMIKVGYALWLGRGVTANPRRGVDWLQRAADLGWSEAKLYLGYLYLFPYLGRWTSNFPPDPQAALLWFGRAAEAGEPRAYLRMAEMMETGRGLPSPQPELAERYYRLAAASGNREAQVRYADRLATGRVIVKTENAVGQRIDLLKRALSQGSAEAAVQLARIYRSGENGEKEPLEAIRYAFQAIALATEADPTEAGGNPYHELDAGILLVNMVKHGEAVSKAGRPLFTQDEIDRMEKYYGRADPVTKEVKVRRLVVPVGCGGGRQYKQIWVWDWGREESPTEPQFRFLEREEGCRQNNELRQTLASSFATARKNKVAFADLIDQQIKSAKLVADAEADRRRRR